MDSADEDITVEDKSSIDRVSLPPNATLVNGSYVLPKDSGIAKSDGKVHTVKAKKKDKPKITMTGRPSCTRCARNGEPYVWSEHTYLNYCPNCHHWNCLTNKHKRGAVHEQEISCGICDCDYCIRCGKEKYSWSRKYLKKP